MRRPFLRGSAILFALIVMAIGSVALAAWINLLANRVLYAEQLSAGVDRRITLQNSRALATQYLLQNVLPLSYSTPLSASVADNWGAFSAAGPAGGNPLTPLESVDQPAGSNPFSPGSDGGYTVDIPVTLSDGVNDTNWTFQTRSRSPMFAYDLFTSQRPTLNAGGDPGVSVGLHANESSRIWNSATYGLTVDRFQTPALPLPGLSLLNGGGSTVLVSNFPFSPVTSGNVGTFWGYNGAVADVYSASTINSLTNRVLSAAHVYVNPLVVSNVGGVMSDGSGNVTIDLLEASLMRVFIDGNATAIHLTGHATSDDATADDRPGLLIVYVQTASTSTNDLATIEFLNKNNRRLYLGVQKSTGTGVNFSFTSVGNPLGWRLGMSLENTPAQFNLAGGSLALTGGLRTDSGVAIAGGTISLYREANPKLLERHGDRIGWLESYRQ